MRRPQTAGLFPPLINRVLDLGIGERLGRSTLSGGNHSAQGVEPGDRLPVFFEGTPTLRNNSGDRFLVSSDDDFLATGNPLQ